MFMSILFYFDDCQAVNVQFNSPCTVTTLYGLQVQY